MKNWLTLSTLEHRGFRQHCTIVTTFSTEVAGLLCYSFLYCLADCLWFRCWKSHISVICSLAFLRLQLLGLPNADFRYYLLRFLKSFSLVACSYIKKVRWISIHIDSETYFSFNLWVYLTGYKIQVDIFGSDSWLFSLAGQTACKKIRTWNLKGTKKDLNS